MQQTVGLAETYARADLQQAMTRARAVKNFGYGPLHRILRTQQTTPEALPGVPAAAAPVPGLPAVVVEQRDPVYYAAREEGRHHG